MSNNDGCFEIIVLGILSVLVMGGALILDKMSCSSRWSDFETTWGPVAGCKVHIDNRWIPEDRVREVQP